MRVWFYINSLLTGIVSYGTSMLLTFGIFKFDDMEVQRIIFGTLISAGGGLGVALLPLGEKSWSWLGFCKLVLLGIIVGPPTAMVLSNPGLAWLGWARPYVQMGIGILAYPIVVAVRDGGPGRFFAMLARLRSVVVVPPPPSIPPSLPPPPAPPTPPDMNP